MVAAAAIRALIGLVWKRFYQIRKKTYGVVPEDATATEPEEEDEEDDEL